VDCGPPPLPTNGVSSKGAKPPGAKIDPFGIISTSARELIALHEEKNNDSFVTAL
jgi:hypothetical protein